MEYSRGCSGPSSSTSRCSGGRALGYTRRSSSNVWPSSAPRPASIFRSSASSASPACSARSAMTSSEGLVTSRSLSNAWRSSLSRPSTRTLSPPETSRSARIASTVRGSFSGKMPIESPAVYATPESPRSTTTWRVSFDEPSALSGVLDFNRAMSGLSRVPSGAVFFGLGAGLSSAGSSSLLPALAASCSASSSFNLRSVSLAPGTQRFTASPSKAMASA